MEFETESALVEAVLFLESEPVSEKQIASISLLSEEVVKKCLEILTEKYNKTKFNKYFFNPAYEQLFSYDLFWNEA